MLWIQKVEPFVGLSQLTSTLSQSIPSPLWISRESFTSGPRTEGSTRSRHRARESWETSSGRSTLVPPFKRRRRLLPIGTLVIGADDWAYYGITPARGTSGAKIKWRFQTQGTLISSPTVDTDGTVFVASMDGKVYALKPPREAGEPVKVRWTFASGGRDDKGGFENAPAIDNEGTLYIA